MTKWKMPLSLSAAVLCAANALLCASTLSATRAGTPPSAARQQTSFASPQLAANALAAAWRSHDKRVLLNIFGNQGWKLVSSGDPIADRATGIRFVGAYDAGHRLESDAAGNTTLILGREGFPYPIPLVQSDHAWRFDSAAGAQEILDRRVGRNEKYAIDVCHELVEAQREYAAADPLGAGRHGFATQIISSNRHRHDGLYWVATEDAPQSPLGPLVASAVAQGYAVNPRHQAEPYHGYLYRLLSPAAALSTGRGASWAHAEASTRLTTYVFLAFPAKYANSGIMTFAVTQDGIVYQKNLGPSTAGIVGKMSAFQPDVSWATP